MDRRIGRRHLLKLVGGAAGAASCGLLSISCEGETASTTPGTIEEETTAAPGPGEETTTGHQEAGGSRREIGSGADRGRLLARQGPPRTGAAASAGLSSLGLGSERDGLLYVPEGYGAAEGTPLAVVLHGSTGDARSGISPFLDLADEAGLVLLAPESCDRRDWDVFLGGYGPDVEFIDRALEHTFDRLAVDAGRLALAGFSDGATYALSLGLTNGDLFTHVMSFAPGLMAPTARRGKPRFFVAHGTDDEVLPIDKTSRRLVPQLERGGYEVRYVEFDGGHTVPPRIADEAVGWFVGGQS